MKRETETETDLAEIEVDAMKTLLEKLERMMTTILEVMEVEPGFDTASPLADEEFAASNEVNSDHNLIELCW